MLTFLSACSMQTESIDSLDKISIGMSVATLHNPYFVSLKDEILTQASLVGMEVEVIGAEEDANKQLSDVNELIQKEIDILIIIPVAETTTISQVVQIANKKNIPVISVDRPSSGGKIATYIKSDNVSGGEMGADYIVEKLGKYVDVAELRGNAGEIATNERGQGFHNIADRFLNVANSKEADFDRKEGKKAMEQIIQETPEVQAIFAHNDEMAIGALEAIQESGKDIMVVGFDGTDDSLAAIMDGEIEATVAQQPKVLAQYTVHAIQDIIYGNNVDDIITVPLRLVTKK